MEQDPAQPDRSADLDATEHPSTSEPHAVIPDPVDPSATGGPRSDTHDADPPRERDRYGNRNLTAVILIIVGAGVLAAQAFGASFDNWWALFILIPAFASLSKAWSAYQKQDGEFTSQVVRPGVTGVVLLVLVGVFLFDLDWSLMGGLVVILIGAAMLARNRSKD